MAEEKHLVGRDQPSALVADDLGLFPRDALNPAVRVREQLCPGLWQFEDENGQLYLAVKQPGWSPARGGDLGARW